MNINTEIVTHKRAYRGNNSFHVSWKSNGFPDQRDFDSRTEAEAFIAKLKAENQTKATPPPVTKEGWSEQTKTLLSVLHASPEDLNAFLERLAATTKHGFAKWEEYTQHSNQIRIKFYQLAFAQSLSAEAYLEKLEKIGKNPIDEILDVYEAHNTARRETKETLERYIKKLSEEEGDEDEVTFVSMKIERFLESFKYNIFKVEEDDITNYISEQKGSDNAKARLADMLLDFKTFSETTE